MSTAILQLSENGDLQRIHDKWLMQSSCSLDTTELESDRLHLKSFWGLFLICGIACSVSLFIYLLQVLNKLRHAEVTQHISTSPGNSQSGRLKRFLSIIDERKDQSNSGSKRKKIVRSFSDNVTDGKLELKQTEMTARSDINSDN